MIGFCIYFMNFFFFFNDTATTEIYTLSLHDALPICLQPFEVALAGKPEILREVGWAGEIEKIEILTKALRSLENLRPHIHEVGAACAAHLVARFCTGIEKPRRFCTKSRGQISR